MAGCVGEDFDENFFVNQSATNNVSTAGATSTGGNDATANAVTSTTASARGDATTGTSYNADTLISAILANHVPVNGETLMGGLGDDFTGFDNGAESYSSTLDSYEFNFAGEFSAFPHQNDGAFANGTANVDDANLSQILDPAMTADNMNNFGMFNCNQEIINPALLVQDSAVAISYPQTNDANITTYDGPVDDQLDDVLSFDDSLMVWTADEEVIFQQNLVKYQLDFELMARDSQCMRSATYLENKFNELRQSQDPQVREKYEEIEMIVEMEKA
ncbi:hypothetical protein NKR23_g6003 [Pleurostoma richardsiae]|uniref:Uncharacterized protein n=1 Tax=Pleurostoma richardsiae TaxID=41990 RepID=A0AA38RQU6_9PEZI|nr:hypothetical protein NKR23_g6003 [Pleurostoma richardsiae]